MKSLLPTFLSGNATRVPVLLLLLVHGEKEMPHVLTDHETIRRWAEARGAKPARVNPGREARLSYTDDPICLQIPGASAEGVCELITWHEWFRKFDEHELALLIENAHRQPSTFNRLVKRNA
jgi:hypothetical protein